MRQSLAKWFIFNQSTASSILSQYSYKQRNITFFQNRFGFPSEDLMLKCQFRNKTSLSNKNDCRSRSLIDSNIFLTNFNQLQGFKTKQKSSAENLNKASDFWLGSSSDTSFDSEKLFDSLRTKQQPQPNSKTLGSIFDKKILNATVLTKDISNENKDIDSKLKIAFAQGLIYAKMEEKRNNPFGPFRFLFLFLSAVFAMFLISLSINVPLSSVLFPSSNSKSSGNGMNGIRALTGSVNYEVNPENVTVKFDDVKGLPEAKKELSEIVDFLKDPEKYTKLGARLPKGILLIGPPGCGKTLLAKSVAGEAGVPYFQASGSDFDEMFVGTGSKRVRQLFAAARAKAPCVIFIDEIDSVGSTRTNSAIHPHANQTINQLLAEMDGFQKNEGVIVLGATNRRETLDSALMRPGRFDVEVRIDKPDLNQRIEILEYYLDKVARDDDIDVKYLAKQLTGLGGSSIENVVNQAALRAVITDSHSVKMEHLEWALDRALMGYGKSRIQDEECNRNTAYHEAGHVLVAYFTKDSDPLHKVTILPRSQSLGHTAFVPDDEGYSKTKSQLLAQMDVAMGGRVAEEFAFGSDKVTTGASSDFKKATQIAVQMIKIFGMNEKVGIRVFDGDKNTEDLSPQTQELLDQEIKKQLNDSYERAKSIIKTHSNELKLIADALLKHETLDVDQIKKIIDQKRLL